MRWTCLASPACCATFSRHGCGRPIRARVRAGFAPAPRRGKVERRSEAEPIPGGLLGPAWVRLAEAPGEPELFGAPGMPGEGDPGGVQPWPSMDSHAMRASGVKGLGALLADTSNRAAALPGSSVLASAGQVAPRGPLQMSQTGWAALRRHAAIPGGRQQALARSRGGSSSARPRWEDSVSALDAYLRDPQSEAPDVSAAGPAGLMAELAMYPTDGLPGRRFAGSTRTTAAKRRRRRGGIA